MIFVSIGLFALAAIIGLTILFKWLTKKEVSRAVVYSHGAAAVTAFLLLIVFAIQHPDNFPKISIILFAVAASAGIYMFFLDINNKPRPIVTAFVHALVAVSAFVILLIFAFTQAV